MIKNDQAIIIFLLFALGGCAANYSQDASGFASGVSDLKTANTTLSDTRILQIQTYYSIKRGIRNAAPVATAACHDFALNTDPSKLIVPPDDRRDCFIWDSGEPREIARQQRAGRRAALASGIVLSPDLPPVPSTAPTTPSTAPAVPLTPQQIRARLKSLDVPDVCIDYALSPANLQDNNSSKEETADEKAQRLYNESFSTQQRVFTALEAYSQGLAAITKQSDVDDYKAAATKLSSSVGTLASAAGTMAGGAGAVIAGPVAKAVTTLVLDIRLAALQHERYQALKSAVLAACIPIHAIGLGEQTFMSGEYSDVQLYNKKIIDAVMTAPPPARKANNDTLMQAVASFRTQTAPPDRVVSAFVKAHDKLMQDVLDGKGQTQAAMDEITTFATDAKALKDAFQTKKTGS